MNSTERNELNRKIIDLLHETRERFFVQPANEYNTLDLKGLNQLVTNNDVAVEKHLVSELGKLIPQSSFLTEEETGARSRAEYEWVIDPIDGTTNYVHKIPVFSISVALMQNGKTIAGYVYEINRNELFSAIEGDTARLNGEEISVRKDAVTNESLVATGFPYFEFDKVEKYLEILKFAMKNTRGVRRLGSAAVDLAYVACGRFDAFFEYDLNAWDVAAGIYIVEMAGGKVSTFKPEGDPIFDKEILAGAPMVYADFLHAIKGIY